MAQSSIPKVPNEIIVFHYPGSPYSVRVLNYLHLRQIPYAQCMQPHMLPRPDLARLGIHYRRIPLIAIGGDVYCDTRLIIAKLEERFSNSSSFKPLPKHAVLSKLFESWTIDGGVFPLATRMMATDSPIFKDPNFIKDRQELTGNKFSPEAMLRGRPEALVLNREVFDFLESSVFSDGREWVAGGRGPGREDIDASFCFAWVKSTLPKDLFSPSTFPKTFAWLDRWHKLTSAAKKQLASQVVSLDGEQTFQAITAGARADKLNDSVISDDPLGFQKGDRVRVWPLDTGSKHYDEGQLVGLSIGELVIEVTAEQGKSVLLHFPRWGFRAVKVGPEQSAKL